MLIDFSLSSPAQCTGVLISYDWNKKHIEGVYRYEPPQDKINKMAMCPAIRLKSAWASAQSDQSLRSALNG